jgi:hypothetical protein
MTNEVNKKSETKPVPAVSVPFARTAKGAGDVVQDRVNQELRHPPTPRLRRDEPMHPYGLD